MKDRYMIRQGDVLLVEVDSIPESADINAKDPNGLAVLAYGEVSGHAHVTVEEHPGDVRYVRTREGERFLALLNQTLTKHGTLMKDGVVDGTADHSALLTRNGMLQQAFQVEDFGEEVRRVAD